MPRTAWPYAGLCVLCSLVLCLVACHPPRLFPEPWQAPEDNLIPGTDPPPQPITTPYPEVERDYVWRMPGGDQFNSGRACAAGPQAPQLLWRRALETELCGDAQVGSDGRLYIAAGRVVVILDQAGRRVGSFELAAQPDFWGLTGTGDGRFYYFGSDSLLRAIDEQGVELWNHAFTGTYLSRLHYDSAGNLYTMDSQGRLYALSAEGEQLWSFDDPNAETEYQIDWSLADDGTVYCISYGGQLKAVRDGVVQWDTLPSRGLGADVYAGNNGFVYVKSINDHQWAYQRKEYLEVFSTAGAWVSALEIGDVDGYGELPRLTGADGTVYCGMSYMSLAAFNAGGTLKWQAPGHVYPGDKPTLGPDGSIYMMVMGLRGNSFDLCRYNPDGTLAWSTPAPFNVIPKPVLLESGSLVLGEYHYLHAYTGGGVLQWTYGVTEPQSSSLVYLPDGQSFISGRCLQAQDAAGAELWRTAYNASALGSPAIGPNGKLYSLGQNTLVSWDGNGALAFSRSTDGGYDYLYGLTIGADGTLLVQGINGSRSLGAYDSGGNRQWIYTDEYAIGGRPAVDSAGNLYFVSNHVDYPPPVGSRANSQYYPPYGWKGSWLKSLARNGALRWSVQLGSQPPGAPVVADDGSVLLAEGSGEVYAYAPADGTRRWIYSPLPAMAQQVLLGAENVAYVICGTRDGSWPPNEVSTAIRAIDADGVQLWEATVDAWSNDAQTDAAGKLYLACSGSYYSRSTVFILGSDGTQSWELPAELQEQPPASDTMTLRLDPLGRIHLFSADEELLLGDGGG